jgi:hypothetical protein
MEIDRVLGAANYRALRPGEVARFARKADFRWSCASYASKLKAKTVGMANPIQPGCGFRLTGTSLR